MSVNFDWKLGDPVEFKHVFELTQRMGVITRDAMIVSNIWNELQSAKGRLRQIGEIIKIESGNGEDTCS